MTNDTLKEEMAKQIAAVREKIDRNEDASQEIATLQQINQLIPGGPPEPVQPPTGNERNSSGAQGTCFVGPDAHVKIVALGGAVTDPLHSGHASIQKM
jgi:hypothetical protein